MKQMKFNEYFQNNDLPAILDNATKELVKDWFYDRRICSNEKFPRYFERACNLHYPYYKQLLRIDPTISQYDWLVENYLEREIKTDSENNHTKSNQTTGSVSGTNGVTTNTSTSNTRNEDLENTGNDSTTTNMDHDSVEKTSALARSTPMSSDSVSSATDPIKHWSFINPNITNPSASNEGMSYGHVGDNGVVSNDSTVRQDNTITDLGTGSTTVSGTTSQTTGSTESGTGRDEGSSTVHEISTGRSNDMVTLLEKAKGYIMTTESWRWLYQQLDKCFLSTYDLDEEGDLWD